MTDNAIGGPSSLPSTRQDPSYGLSELYDLISQGPHKGAGSSPCLPPLAATAPAPPVIISHPAGQHRTVRLDALPGHLQPQAIETAERGQIRRGEGTVDAYPGTDAPTRDPPWIGKSQKIVR